MKLLQSPYTLTLSTRTVYLPTAVVSLDRLLAIVNATRGVTYYEAGNPTLVATVPDANTVIFNASVVTTGHADTDKLIIILDDDNYTPANEGKQDELITLISDITNVLLGNIDAKDFATASKQDESSALLSTIATSPVLPGNAAQETGGNLALIKAKTDNLDISISALRDALRGTDNRTLTDILNQLASELDVNITSGSISVDNLTATFDSTVSTLNSSNTPLLADEVFLGVWEDVSNYAGLTVTVVTDQYSAVGGGRAQWSIDGTDLGIIDSGALQAVTIPPNVPVSFEFSRKAKYFRIRYTNGATAQTSLLSQVIFNLTASTPSKRILGAQLTDYDSAAASAAHLFGRQSTGQWLGAGINSSRELAVNTGTDITTPTAMPAGGVGLRGWLSAIWTKLNDSLAVTGTFWQATQPVSAASLPLPSGAAIAANQQVDAITDAEIRATPLPVSGAVTTGGLTDTELRAAAVPVSLASVPSHAVTNAGTFDVQVTSVPTTPVTGTFFQATQPISAASLPLPALASTAARQTYVAGFAIPEFDYFICTYVGSTNNIATTVYKTGGAGGTTVATLTFTYIAAGAADDDDIATVTKS